MRSFAIFAVFGCLLSCLAIRAARADPAPLDTILPNGVRIIAQQETSTQLVAINVFVTTSGTAGSEARSGVGDFAAATLLSGTSNQTEETMVRAIGALGGNVHASWQPDLTQIKALTLSSQFDEAAYLLSDILKNADFSDAAVEQSRRDLLAEQQSRADDLFQTTYDMLHHELYSGTPYAASLQPEEIRQITPAEVRSYFRKTFTPGKIVISVVGNIAPDHVESAFGGDLLDFSRTGGHERVPEYAYAPRTKAMTVKRYQGDLSAGVIMAGFLAPGAGDTDYPAMLVTNALLGGMKTSRLFTNLRTKSGYGYEVASLYPNQLQVSDVSAYIITGPAGKTGASDYATVKDALVEQFRQFRQAPPSPEDLARAKRFLIGSYLLQHERLEDRAYYLGYSEIALKPLGGFRFDTHYDEIINAVTAADVRRVAQKYLTDGAVLALLLPGNPNAGVVNE